MKKENNTIDFIEFPSKNIASLAEARQFYTEVFSWTFNQWGEAYADTASSGLGCGLNADPAHRSPAPLVVIYVADLEQAMAKVTAAGGTISKDIFSFPGGRRFHFTDPAGNMLAVWSER